jgi:hypothetical protein
MEFCWLCVLKVLAELRENDCLHPALPAKLIISKRDPALGPHSRAGIGIAPVLCLYTKERK